MNLDTVMKELGTAAATITGLRVQPWAAKSVTPPALVFGLPDEIIPNDTYARGSMLIRDLPAILLVGQAVSRTALTELAAYCAGTGPKSLTAVWQGYGGYTQIHALTVAKIEPDAVKMAGVDYLAAIFHLDVIGSGTT